MNGASSARARDDSSVYLQVIPRILSLNNGRVKLFNFRNGFYSRNIFPRPCATFSCFQVVRGD